MSTWYAIVPVITPLAYLAGHVVGGRSHRRRLANAARHVPGDALVLATLERAASNAHLD